jgi:putative DNA primase/helicase
MDDTKEIYWYDEIRGVYVNKGEIIIETQCESMKPDISSYGVGEVIDHIRRRTYIDRAEFDKEPDIINVKNGLLNIQTKQLKPHTPNYLSLTQLSNLVYKPKAKCPKMIEFFKQVLESKQSVSTIIRLFGYILLKETSTKYEKAFMFVGTGSNGKSVMTKLIDTFVGLENCSHVSLQNLNSRNHRFMISELYGKLVNTHPDIPAEEIQNSGLFKAVVSGDTIFGEKKHKAPFSFKNKAKLIFSANEIPDTSDRTYAFYRRWVIEAFKKYFAGENRNENLINELTTESELSGLLNIALVGMQRLIRDHGFNEKSIEAVREQYEQDTTLVKEFLRDKCSINLTDPKYFTLKSALYHVFIEYCNTRKTESLDINDFEKELISIGIVPGRATVNTVKSSVYTGVMTNEEIDTKSREKLSKDKHKQEQQDQQQTTL